MVLLETLAEPDLYGTTRNSCLARLIWQWLKLYSYSDTLKPRLEQCAKLRGYCDNIEPYPELITGQARLTRSYSLASISFEISGNIN